MKLHDIRKAYFVGIGGVGMSALAQLLIHQGVTVSGSDREISPMTKLLKSKGVVVIIGHQSKNVSPDTDVLVYSDAIPLDNPERIRANELGIEQFSYFEMLGQVSVGKRTVAISGTHGKTTTTGMLAKILIDANAKPTVIIGSIVKDFDSNYVAGTSNIFVVEACEYRDHLLKLSPEVLVINNLEWDHTDYFPSLAVLQETFRKAIFKVPLHGAIVTDPSNQNIAPLLIGAVAPIIDYTKEIVPSLTLPGEFNVSNARAAASAARAIMPDITTDTISASLKTFHGIWRRFEYKGITKNGADVYDDYAHHPTAVRATLKALRAKTQGKLFITFHPHLFSRTRDLLDDFAVSFDDADDVLVAPIYAARETDDGTVSSTILAKRITENGTPAQALSFEQITTYLKSNAHKGDTIMTMGAGDIYHVADALIKKS